MKRIVDLRVLACALTLDRSLQRSAYTVLVTSADERIRTPSASHFSRLDRQQLLAKGL